jgi:hypothetical protein
MEIMLVGIHEGQQQVNKLLAHPFWQPVSQPTRQDYLIWTDSPLKKYASVGLAVRALQESLSTGMPVDSPPMVRVRRPPIIFELWSLKTLLDIFGDAGFFLMQSPVWYSQRDRQRAGNTVSVRASRFALIRGPWVITIDYDQALPRKHVNKTAEGLWMDGRHDRPDFLLQYRKDERLVNALIIDAKFRSAERVWNTSGLGQGNSVEQLEQYWSGLMSGRKALYPPVLCTLPLLDQSPYRPSKNADVIFLRTDPLHSDGQWKEDFARMLLSPLNSHQEHEKNGSTVACAEQKL